MFQGSIPQSFQQILGDIVKDWNVFDIYVGYSGNFTIERVLHGTKAALLHGNDVTIYSCLLGAYFSGQSINARFKESYTGPMTFVQEYMRDDESVISVMLLLSRMAVYLGSKPNPYYEKMITAYTAQWKDLFCATDQKIRNIKPFLKSFYAGDVINWVDDVPQEHGFSGLSRKDWPCGRRSMRSLAIRRVCLKNERIHIIRRPA